MPIKFRAQSQEEADILIYGDIGESFWSEETVTAKSFRKNLDAVGSVKKLNIYINSSGGNVFDAQAIYSMLQRHAAQKTVYIDGIAASAASVIAMAGNKIIMPANAIIMIHRAWTITAGNANDMRKMADTLEIVDGTIIEVYQTKSGLDEEKIIELLDAETWMTAEEATGWGFADEIEKAKELVAFLDGTFLTINGQKFDLSRFKNPPAMTQAIKAGVVPSDVSREKAPEDEPWEAPTLSDFTDEQWEDLSDAEKRRIAGHYAWAKAMPPEKFGDLKLPHHRADDGAVVWRGVANAAARLAQSDIPAEDKAKVQSHLGSHYQQFNREPPWQSSQETQIRGEGRTLSAANEKRIMQSRDLLSEVLDQLNKDDNKDNENNITTRVSNRQTPVDLFIKQIQLNRRKADV